MLALLPRPLRDLSLLQSVRAIDAQQKLEGFTGPLILEFHYLDGNPTALKVKPVLIFKSAPECRADP